jgi:hypothetical protein
MGKNGDMDRNKLWVHGQRTETGTSSRQADKKPRQRDLEVADIETKTGTGTSNRYIDKKRPIRGQPADTLIQNRGREGGKQPIHGQETETDMLKAADTETKIVAKSL